MLAYIRTRSFFQVIIHLLLMAVFVMAILMAFFYLYLPWSTKHGKVVEVPNLIGVSLNKLEEKLEARGLKLIIVDSTYSKEYRPYTVLEQYPMAYQKVKRGRKVYLTVSPKSPPFIKMPNLTGYTYPMAMMHLRSFNLELGNIEFKPDMAMDVVLSQQVNGKMIEEGTKVQMGTKIDILVGNGVGDEEFDVPNLEGLNLEQAEEVLKGYDLALGIVNTDNTSNKPYGTIIRQSPGTHLHLKEDEKFDEDGRVIKKSDEELEIIALAKEKAKELGKTYESKHDPNAPKSKIRSGEIIDIWVSGKGETAEDNDEDIMKKKKQAVKKQEAIND